MRELLPEFCGEKESGVGRHSLDPQSCVVWAHGLVEGRIDFDGVEEFGQEGGFVEIFWAGLRVDVAGPIGVGPSGWADAQARRGILDGAGGHQADWARCLAVLLVATGTV